MNRTSLVGHVLELFELIDRNGQPPDRLTSDFFRARKYLGSHDRRSISEPVFGIIRHRRFIEALLEEYIAKHPGAELLDTPHNRYLPLFALYTSVVENHLDPMSQDSAVAVPEALWKTYFPNIDVREFIQWIAQHKGLDFLDNDPVIQLGVKHSFQDWMVEEWLGQVGDATENLLQVLNSPASITLRVNLRKISREECRQRLHAEGLETEPTAISPAGLIAKKRFNAQSLQSFKDGWFELQDEGSQVVALALNPKQGNIVIDACAGAGGKSLHIADLMDDTGEIIAIDVDARRLSELQIRAGRGGIHNIQTQLRENMLPENFFGKADIVLVDAPCSGVGTIRRNPSLKWSVTESLVAHYADMQKEILTFNAPFVKPGGNLIYTTCSLLRKENEEVVNSFLTCHKNFEVSSLTGFTSLAGCISDAGFVTLYPHALPTDGFFIAVMKRCS